MKIIIGFIMLIGVWIILNITLFNFNGKISGHLESNISRDFHIHIYYKSAEGFFNKYINDSNLIVFDKKISLDNRGDFSFDLHDIPNQYTFIEKIFIYCPLTQGKDFSNTKSIQYSNFIKTYKLNC